MNGSERLGWATADWINLGKNLALYVAAMLVTWGLGVLVPTLEAEGGTLAAVAVIVAGVLKACERWLRDTRGTIDGPRGDA